MSSVTREIKEEEERSVALEQKIKLDLEKLKVGEHTDECNTKVSNQTRPRET